jgi:hypothetical protein
MKIDLSHYYRNSNFEYNGISLNFWAKFEDISEFLEKPVAMIDPYLITYNSTYGNYFLRNSNFNYLFSFSNYFPILMNYTTSNAKTFYEKNWIPYSVGISYSVSLKNFFIQVSLNNEISRSIIQYDTRIPELIFFFNYFSKIQYRFIKIWDRYLTSDELNSINYMYFFSFSLFSFYIFED